MWFVAIFWWVASTALQAILRPKQSIPRPKPLGAGEFTAPTVQEGRPVTAWWGTAKLDGPNVCWWGDLLAIDAAFDETTGGGIFSGGLPAPGSGIYHYHLGMHLDFGWGPIDEVIEIRFDDRPIGPGKIVIDDTNDLMRMGRPGGNPPDPDDPNWVTAALGHGSYAPSEIGPLVADAAFTAQGERIYTWYHFNVVAGFMDTLTYRVDYNDGTPRREVTFTMTPGANLRGFEFAEMITRRAEQAEFASTGGTPEVKLDVRYGFDGHFDVQWAAHFGVTNVDRASLVGTPALAMIGTLLSLTCYDTGTGWDLAHAIVITSELAIHGSRWHFGWGATYQRIVWDDPFGRSSSKSIFGGLGRQLIGTGLDPIDDPRQYDCAETRALPTGYQITDLGDFWRIFVNAPTLFGGDQQDGGVVGNFDLYKGTETQVANDYLESVLGAPQPARLGHVYMVARRVYFGTQPVLKTIGIVGRRTPNGLALTDGKQNISGDANPACMIYEIATNHRWGCDLPPDSLDLDSLVAMGNALSAEGLGLTMVMDTTRQAEEQIREIVRHIDGAVYSEPGTGLIRAKLIRPDYDPDDLLVVDEDVAGEVTELTPEPTANFVTVKYVNRSANWSERTARAYDAASISRVGRLDQDIEFGGCGRAQLAQLLAARALLSMSTEWKKFRLPANRRTSALRPGDAFMLKSARLGIAAMPCRVTSIDLGTQLGEDIPIEARQDIYGATWTAFAPPVTEWEDPSSPPVAPAATGLMETPFVLGGGEHRRISTFAARAPGDTSIGYHVYSNPDGGDDLVVTNTIGGFTPAATLAADVSLTDDTITIDNAIDVELLASASDAEFAVGKNLIAIGDEIVAWRTIADNGDGTWTLGGVVRGVCDTVPWAHAAGDRCWMLSQGRGTTQEDEYPADRTIRARLVPFNSSGVVAPETVPALTATTNSRARRPYAPRDVLVNGAAYPTTIAGELSVSWAHRDRLGGWDFHDGGVTDAIEAGCGYRLRFFSGDTLLREVSGLTGTSYTWTSEAADSGGELNSEVRVELATISADGLLDSFGAYGITVRRSGFGYGYGDSYGG